MKNIISTRTPNYRFTVDHNSIVDIEKLKLLRDAARCFNAAKFKDQNGRLLKQYVGVQGRLGKHNPCATYYHGRVGNVRIKREHASHSDVYVYTRPVYA